MTEHVADQTSFHLRFDWGRNGLEALAPHSDVVVIVDVLRFTTTVAVAVSREVTVFPYPWDMADAPAYAAHRGAVLAGRREDGALSLSPADMAVAAPRTRVVLPSPNGAALSVAAREHPATHVLAGSLRNAGATARRARHLAGPDGSISVIAAGERWDDGSLRPSVEDALGAGAILFALDPSAAVGAPRCSPEAALPRAAFLAARAMLGEALRGCASGRELVERGWSDDVDAASLLDVSDVAAELVEDHFIAAR